MSTRETYTLAHTARCKLQLAADRPDRNLRFILGHAFTLDKLRLRIAEIETEYSDDDDVNEISDTGYTCQGPGQERRVSFHHNHHHSHHPAAAAIERKRSPPPPPGQFADLGSESDSDEEEDEEEEIEDEDMEDDSLSLRRYESGTARQQPEMVDDEDSSGSGSGEDEDEPKSPLQMMMPSEAELRMVVEGDGDDELTESYGHVAGCPCHGTKGPSASHVWQLPKRHGPEGVRYAVVAVDE